MYISNAETYPEYSPKRTLTSEAEDEVLKVSRRASSLLENDSNDANRVLTYPTNKNQNEHLQANLANQKKELAFNLVTQHIKQLTSNILPGTPTSQLEHLLTSLSLAQDEDSFLEKYEELVQTSLLNERRLEHAVEVNFKAYLPEKAPILYKDWKRENKGKNAIDCLNEVYGKYLEQGVLYQDDLGGKDGLDPDLMQAIKNFCIRKNLPISETLPPKTAKHSKLSLNLDVKKAQLINSLYRKNKK